MRPIFLLSLLAALVAAPAQTPPAAPPATLRSTLLQQLHFTHDKAEWFTPINSAVAGLTPDQAKWIPRNAAGQLDPAANHSAGMLAYHIWFWNTRALAQLKKQPLPKPPANEETFNDFNAANWPRLVADLNQVMLDFEDLITHASDAELARWAPTIADICGHNAYHTGQIIYVRKLQGVWNPANGVK